VRRPEALQDGTRRCLGNFRSGTGNPVVWFNGLPGFEQDRRMEGRDCDGEYSEEEESDEDGNEENYPPRSRDLR